jgi:hypothetical protein
MTDRRSSLAAANAWDRHGDAKTDRFLSSPNHLRVQRANGSDAVSVTNAPHHSIGCRCEVWCVPPRLPIDVNTATIYNNIMSIYDREGVST